MKASFTKVHNLRKQLVDSPLFFYLKSGTLALFMRVVGMGFGYLLTFFIARYYGAEALGLFSIILTIILISSVLSRLGIDTALLRFISEFHAKKEESKIKDLYFKGLFVSLFGGCLVGLALFFSAPFISQVIFSKPQLEFYIKILSFFLPLFSLTMLHSQILRARQKFLSYVFFQYPTGHNIVLFFTLLVLFFLLGNFLSAPIYSFFFSIFLLFFLSMFFMYQLGIFSSKKEHSLSFPSLLKTSFPLLFVSSLLLLMNWMDTIMLTVFSSTQEVGVYNAALRLAGLSNLILFGVNSITGPKFASLYSLGKMKEFKKLVQVSTHVIIVFSFPVFLILAFFSPYLMSFFGADFIFGWKLLIILAFGQFINSFAAPAMDVMNMTGREKVVQYILAFSLFLNFTLNYLLIPLYGSQGAAYASVASVLFIVICSSLYLRKSLGFWLFGGINYSLSSLRLLLKKMF